MEVCPSRPNLSHGCLSLSHQEPQPRADCGLRGALSVQAVEWQPSAFRELVGLKKLLDGAAVQKEQGWDLEPWGRWRVRRGGGGGSGGEQTKDWERKAHGQSEVSREGEGQSALPSVPAPSSHFFFASTKFLDVSSPDLSPNSTSYKT